MKPPETPFNRHPQQQNQLRHIAFVRELLAYMNTHFPRGCTENSLATGMGEPIQRIQRYTRELINAGFVSVMGTSPQQRGKVRRIKPIASVADLMSSDSQVRAAHMGGGNSSVLARRNKRTGRLPSKQKQHKQLAADVEAFLAAGGEVEDLGSFAEPDGKGQVHTYGQKISRGAI